ncbi:hypothetical protein PBV87_07885 [Niameybacter massiliensis]|uniref:Uncharacterized protein n=1 Tax=Holtiella tumoricola TaxID=3018743 RepID=A0AA42DLZ8_9FIRM|nr:DUF6550 family protein [Holtiella tumoricola]MDA3731394.1 hypothetical protein [Holtiella tumoricola]
MKNMNDKTKKWLTVAGGLAVSALLITLITGQFRIAPINDVEIPPQNNDGQSVVVETLDITEKENDTTVPDIKVPEQSENSNGDDIGTDQTIQPNIPEKPTYTEEELTNQNQKPNGDPVTENDKVQDHDKVEKPVTPPKADNQPQSGDKSDGKIYVPGFGWIDDVGDGHGSVAEDMYENGNKVGIMD